MRMVQPNDWNGTIAGLVAAALVVGLALGLSVPFVIAAGISALVFGGPDGASETRPRGRPCRRRPASSRDSPALFARNQSTNG
jgi:hypothetical protein